ncbi:MAG: class I SAM-dependent methyltransferase, partial [Alphaproteobacteria bacterium]|nr:class I SAM-dependent methyltransferase [Alphaproteobacteria bacterium]
MTPAETTKASFWDRSARRYAARPVADEKAYQTTLECTRAWLKPTDQVLEIGCGTGSTAIRLAPHAGRITGSDISPEMIAIAEERCREAGPGNVSFLSAALSDAQLESTLFDAVIAFNVLHLLEDLPAALVRAGKLLRPGGLLISKTPCLGDMSVLLRLVIPAMQLFGKAPPVSY